MPAIAAWDEFKLERFILDLLARSGVPIVTALPGNPVDGQEVMYLASDTDGVVWHLKYRPKSAGASKWEFIGGSPLWSEVAALQTTISDTYAGLTTAGPSIVLPIAGDYMVTIGCRGFSDTNGGGANMSYDIGGTGAVDADYVSIFGGNANTIAASMSREKRKNGLTAVTLTAKYRRPAALGTTSFENRWMSVKPVRLG